MTAIEPRQEFKDMKAYALKWAGKHNVIHKLQTIIDADIEYDPGVFDIVHRPGDSYIALLFEAHDGYVLFKSTGNNIHVCHPGNWIDALDALYAEALLRISDREAQTREELEQRIAENFETCHVWGMGE